MTESDLAESDPTPEGPAPIPLASPAEGVGPRILAEMENRMTARKPGPKPWKAA